MAKEPKTSVPAAPAVPPAAPAAEVAVPQPWSAPEAPATLEVVTEEAPAVPPAAPAAEPVVTETALETEANEGDALDAVIVDETTAPTPAPVVAPEVTETELPKLQTVTVTVPAAYELSVDHHDVRKIKPGIQEMEIDLANHWYSIANGVTIYKP